MISRASALKKLPEFDIEDADHHILPSEASVRPQNSQGSRSILIADSDPASLRLLSTIVEEAGFKAVTAQNGRDAHRILQSNANFAAGIFELVLPHVSGPDLVRNMMRDKRLKNMPVIMTTGTRSMRLSAESFAAGARALVPKPFTPTQLKVLLLTLANKSAAATSGPGMVS